MPGKVYLGCSGWAYKSWRPGFYPATTPLKNLLDAYAARLNAVEVNYTFRTLPSASTTAGWLEKTPGHFRFAFKAPERITHRLGLRGAGEPLRALARALRPMAAAGRMGPVLFQLPPRFAVDTGLLDSFLGDFSGAFAEVFSGSFPAAAAWEFRDASWFTDATYAVLARHGAVLCAAESDTLRSPDLPLSAGLRVFRLRRSGYTAEELAGLAEHFSELARSGAAVYGFFMHEEAPNGPRRAATVLAQIPEELRG